VREAQVPGVTRVLEDTLRARPGLRLTRGRKILELQPAIDWNKGRAMEWLLHELSRDGGRLRPIYIGDDATDEDAFSRLGPAGVGILVARSWRPTRARYRLDDPDAVQRFLDRLAGALEPCGRERGTFVARRTGPHRLR
jgi:trehalose 6-phosphate phosphatase